MTYSKRVLNWQTVGRMPDGTLTLEVGEHTLYLTADELKAMVAYSETGTDRPETDDERKAREKGEAFAKFLDGLILPK